MTTPRDAHTRDCAGGWHAPLVALPPVEHAAAVNIDHVCPACGGLVYTESWTRAAWLDQQLDGGRPRRRSSPTGA